VGKTALELRRQRQVLAETGGKLWRKGLKVPGREGEKKCARQKPRKSQKNDVGEKSEQAD